MRLTYSYQALLSPLHAQGIRLQLVKCARAQNFQVEVETPAGIGELGIIIG